ncbi:DYH11 protein, partial [Polypterus senegalus]|nr:DYH11 protein [Polypterus senegalus]
MKTCSHSSSSGLELEIPDLDFHISQIPLFQVLVPVLFSQKNHRKWPLFISQDVTRHVENLKNKIAVVKGQYSGRTVLPIPTVTSKIEDTQNEYIYKQDYSNTTVVHAIETMVISWTHQIRDLLKTDSAQPLLEGLNPNPKTELEFWKERKENMIYISNQLNSPIVQKMVRILAVSDSTYYPTFKEIFQDVSAALIEAQNIELHLRPLQKYIDLLLEEEFSNITDFFTPLFHVICLIWTHSKFYSIPARIVVLLQEFCNLLIDQTMVYLCPEDLLKGEAEEVLEKVQIAVATFTAFKESFLKHREKLPSYALSGEQFRPWDFHSQMVFARFNRFLGRLIEVQLIAVCNFFLERPAVKEVFDPCYPTLLLMVDEELDNCKQLYDSHIQQVLNL